MQWRVVVADAKSPRDGRFIEEIGSYDPIPVDEKIRIKEERFEYWVKRGAQVSVTVKNLLKRMKMKTKKLAAK
jgi:small subunit ribosomal protein S16